MAAALAALSGIKDLPKPRSLLAQVCDCPLPFLVLSSLHAPFLVACAANLTIWRAPVLAMLHAQGRALLGGTGIEWL